MSLKYIYIGFGGLAVVLVIISVVAPERQNTFGDQLLSDVKPPLIDVSPKSFESKPLSENKNKVDFRSFLLIAWTKNCQMGGVSPKEHQVGLDLIDSRLARYTEVQLQAVSVAMLPIIHTQLLSKYSGNLPRLPFIFICLDNAVASKSRSTSPGVIEEQHARAIGVYTNGIERHLRGAIAGREGYELEIQLIKKKSIELMTEKMKSLQLSPFSFMCDTVWGEKTWSQIQDRADRHAEASPFLGHYGQGNVRDYYIKQLRDTARVRIHAELFHLYYLYLRTTISTSEIEEEYLWTISKTAGSVFDETGRWPATVSLTPRPGKN